MIRFQPKLQLYLLGSTAQRIIGCIKKTRLQWQSKALPWGYCEPGPEPASVPSVSNDHSDFSMYAYFTNLFSAAARRAVIKEIALGFPGHQPTLCKIVHVGS